MCGDARATLLEGFPNLARTRQKNTALHYGMGRETPSLGAGRRPVQLVGNLGEEGQDRTQPEQPAS